MVLDPKKHADWEIAQDAETRMKTVQQLGRDMGLLDKELLPYGHVMGKVDYRAVLERLGDKPNGKYVDVTALRPRPSARANPRPPSASYKASDAATSALPPPSASLRAAPRWA